RLRRISGERLPAETIRPVEAQRLAEIVDRGLLFVGDILVFRHPEEIRRDQPRKRGAVLVLGDLGELLAEGLEARIVDARRQRDRYGLVGSERRLRRLRRRVGPAALPPPLGPGPAAGGGAPRRGARARSRTPRR